MYVFGSVWRRRRGGEWMRRLGLGFTNPVGAGECWTYVCVWVALVWVVYMGSREWVGGRGLGTVSGRVGWCYVSVSWES